MKRIPLGWLIAGSFAFISLATLSLAYFLGYSALERVLVTSKMQNMDWHLRFVLGDVRGSPHPQSAPPDWLLAVHRPVELPVGYEQQMPELAKQIAIDSFDVIIMDAKGKLLTSSPQHHAQPLPPPAALKELISRWNTDKQRIHGFGKPRHLGKPPVRPARFSLFRLFSRPPGPLRYSYNTAPLDLHMVVPVACNGKIVGFVQMTSDIRHVKPVLSSFSDIVLIGGAVIGVGSCALGIWLAGILTRPLREVSNVANQVGHGNLGPKSTCRK